MDWKKWIAMGFGLGYLPFAPGTWGTLGGILLVIVMIHLPMVAQMGIIGLLFIFGVFICGSVAKRLGKKDPPEMVWDEIAAFPLVMLLAPINLKTLLLGFVFFRVFDILKPFPCRRLEALPGGWGIMADDAMAALYSSVLLHFSSMVF